MNSDQHLNIVSFCSHHLIENYTINDDGSIDIFNDHRTLVIVYTKLEELPIKINRITGGFNLSSNYKLTTLKNCPNYIDGELVMNVNPSLPGIVQNFLELNKHNPDNIKSFLRYQDYYEVWTPEFNEDNLNELLTEIEEGLR